MVVIANARTTAIANTMIDGRSLVVTKDVLGISNVGTDFAFDALNPLSYEAGALPAPNAQLPTLIVAGAYISAAGSNGTNGTFPLSITGGGGTGAAGTFTVAGGSVTDVNITNPGTGYTGNAAIGVASVSAGLTGVTIIANMADVLNVARDVQPALVPPRTKRVGLSQFAYATRPTFDGKGWKFVNNTTSGMVVQKGGVHPGRVAEPYHEGFLDFLEITTFKADALTGNAMPYQVSGGGGGFAITGSLQPAAKENNAILGTAMSIGELYTIAKRVRFNVGAGTSTIIGYMAHGGIVVTTAELPGKATSAYATTITGSALIGSSSGSAGTAFNGSVYHVYREFIGLSGRTDSDILDVVQRAHERALSRYA